MTRAPLRDTQMLIYRPRQTDSFPGPAPCTPHDVLTRRSANAQLRAWLTVRVEFVPNGPWRARDTSITGHYLVANAVPSVSSLQALAVAPGSYSVKEYAP